MDLGSVASDLANQFGLGDNSSSNSNDNSIDAIAHELAIDHDLKSPAKPETKRLYVSPIAPPISGVSQAESDAINRERLKAPTNQGPQGGSVLDTVSNIAKSAYNKGY